jgi:hypothetical protein
MKICLKNRNERPNNGNGNFFISASAIQAYHKTSRTNRITPGSYGEGII